MAGSALAQDVEGVIQISSPEAIKFLNSMAAHISKDLGAGLKSGSKDPTYNAVEFFKPGDNEAGKGIIDKYSPKDENRNVKEIIDYFEKKQITKEEVAKFLGSELSEEKEREVIQKIQEIFKAKIEELNKKTEEEKKDILDGLVTIIKMEQAKEPVPLIEIIRDDLQDGGARISALSKEKEGKNNTFMYSNGKKLRRLYHPSDIKDLLSRIKPSKVLILNNNSQVEAFNEFMNQRKKEGWGFFKGSDEKIAKEFKEWYNNKYPQDEIKGDLKPLKQGYTEKNSDFTKRINEEIKNLNKNYTEDYIKGSENRLENALGSIKSKTDKLEKSIGDLQKELDEKIKKIKENPEDGEVIAEKEKLEKDIKGKQEELKELSADLKQYGDTHQTIRHAVVKNMKIAPILTRLAIRKDGNKRLFFSRFRPNKFKSKENLEKHKEVKVKQTKLKTDIKALEKRASGEGVYDLKKIKAELNNAKDISSEQAANILSQLTAAQNKLKKLSEIRTAKGRIIGGVSVLVRFGFSERRVLKRAIDNIAQKIVGIYDADGAQTNTNNKLYEFAKKILEKNELAKQKAQATNKSMNKEAQQARQPDQVKEVSSAR